ncbi:ATP-binding cassette transporter snq2 [Exophiala xenobiotica]|uniref:ATP-binding cassette transporter snq2 n=1 Tax=Vermiconidia calcicola TaxID=1690605 RepID=A0AAV9QFP9_9PEZI|nr:ATP-binding cassette transporter snq2 [Exophiala xenobiotica]KAK5541060.1 ATP-binding cassette transporter snq2 [Vermiconidia calcicola]KAK5549447.1 ATP-binding cassette transporter snq2 [Chaetothyriales sp. CCFEE 6169]KAK5208069.1 ATP-binding cassette transporter snq2 [Exophiala xenobiotica]KAK5236979.1 ATP-binding cassette transporter snq2 [Exophiala xenobiotica]
MADTLSRALSLDRPTQQHGHTANGHVQEDASPSPSRSETDTVGEVHVVDHGKRNAKSRTSSDSYGLQRTASGVDVERAEKDFAELSKELSSISRRISRTHSRASVPRGKDLEKAITSSDYTSEDGFNLEATLRGNREAEGAAGIKAKYIGVIWENLTVRGIGGVKNFVKVFPDAFVDFFNVPGTIMSILGYGKKGREFSILRDFRGVAKPGEMVLVLGRPGSGCTTFLKVIANQRYGYTGIDGEVLYGPFDSSTFAKMYRGEAVYNQEDDVHHPTLTVGQTLGFALDTKTPGKRPAGMSKAEFKDRIIHLLLKMFNIEHTINTIVGNPFMRGVSGGERKRVSIAEMMITAATVCAWDNSTRGLDASTALDYAKSLRIMTNIYKTTTFVSLYQASENIYKQFDKVMVIDQGRQVFFGPANEARAYFEGLGFMEKPRQTTPDYLTGCTDEFEREYKPGRSSENVPSNPDALVEAFNNSVYSEKLAKEMTAYKESIREEKQIYDDFAAAHREAKRKHTPKNSVYSVPFYLQIWALMQRQFLIKWQDKFSLVVSWATSIIIAIVVGTVWLNQPPTSAGAFTRGGVLFIALLFNAFQAFSELASTMLGRPIVNKHRAYTFHRPGALWLAQIMVDLCFATVQIFVFSVIVYFMTGLVRTPGAFFTFTLIIISGYLSMTLFFRTIGCLCPDFDYAIKFAAVIITLFVITSGYIIQYQSQQVWLRWIFYLNALGLGFSAMMMNEFKRLTMRCTSESLVPSGAGYTNIDHQVCTLPGSVAGSDEVSGTAYVTTGFQYNPDDLWRNWGIIVVLCVAFLFANVVLGETIKYGAGGRTVTYFTKENDERKDLNEKLQERKRRRQTKQDADDSSELNITSKAVLTWENLTYDVPTPSGQLRLLREVFGYVRPGQLTALMGASGAGKTTLLDVLAARKNIGVIGGDILVDGQKPGIGFQRGTSYAEQLDVHESTQTVREALRFSADLRQPYDVPRENKYAYVEEILCLLELENLADAIIGTPESGLSVEERKRVTIGVELAAKPQLLLFLDEPTSGLDSQSAFNIVRFLRKLSAAGQAILCTIHQPNSALFENFDRLLLLQKGGETVYFGDIGKDAHVLLGYFHQHGADCPPDANPAEWMLDAIGAGIAPRIGGRDWGEIWRDSDELATTKSQIVEMRALRQREAASEGPHLDDEKEYASPLWHQIKIVSWRTHLAFWRSPNYGFTRLFNHVAIALISGLAFLQLDDSRSSLQYRVFVVFQVTVIPALILAQVEPMYDFSRLIFYRESAAKAYKQFPFAFAMVCAEMPYSLLCAIFFFIPIYYLAGFNPSSSRAGYQFFIVLITELFSVTAGQMIAALTPSSFISSLINPFVVIIFALFCGVTIPKPQIPGFWRAWLYQLDPFTRLVSGMVTTELHGLPVVCKPHELNSFPVPPGGDCGSYMAEFFERGGAGYLVSNVSDVCQYCAYKVGDQFYEPLQLSFGDRWRDLGIFAAFIASNLILLFLGSRYLNFNRR